MSSSKTSGNNVQEQNHTEALPKVQQFNDSANGNDDSTTCPHSVSVQSKNENPRRDNENSLQRGVSAVSSSSHSSHVEIFELTRAQRLIAGSGHILNDLCASLWFTYFLLYMQKVVKFNDSYAAGLLFWGQVVDGIATPLVGYETDHVETLWPCKKTYGRCKSWHLLGIVLVAVSFPFIFSPCVGYSFYTDEWSRVADWKKAVYYAPFIAIFQTGWACTQISHLALIPKLTPDDLVRTEILAIRYACTVAANVSVFVMTWLFLTDMGDHESCSVGTDDSSSFSYIALLSIGLGGIFSILFHFFVVEKSDQVIKRSVSMLKVQESMSASTDRHRANPNNAINSTDVNTSTNHSPRTPTNSTTREGRLKRNRTPTDLRGHGEGTQALLASDTEDDDIYNNSLGKSVDKSLSVKILEPVKVFSTKSLNAGKENMGVTDWMKLPQFYNVACLYLSTRLAVNLSQSYMPLYVETSLGLGCGAVAVIPLIMYCSGFAISLVIKLLNKYLGRQLAYAIGALLIITGACFILFLDMASVSNTWAIYVVAVLLGGGASAILVTSLSITADLIGNNIESGAFVYGAMSFCDKISCGLAIVLISNLNPCKDEKQQCEGSGSKEFYKDALGFSSGGSAIAGLVFTLLLTLMIVRNSRRQARITHEDETIS